MQGREDHFDTALLRLGMLVDRNAAPVVGNGDRRPVFVERDANVRGIPVHRLVDAVVENLPDEMMKAGGADAADVHAGTLAYGFESFEDGDVFRCVACWHPGGSTGFYE